MALLLSILMSLGLVGNSNVTTYTSADASETVNHAGEVGAGNWEWDNSH
jgi:hypothetical protein